MLPQVCFLQPWGADSPAEGAQPIQESVLLKGAQSPQSPPGALSVPSSGSYTAAGLEHLISCTSSFLHGAAPLSPQPASARSAEGWLRLGAAFWDGIWYFQCYFPPTLPFPWVLFVLLAVALGLWGGFLLPVGL